MSSADTPPFSETPVGEEAARPSKPAASDLASFAVLADPSAIAGAPTEAASPGENHAIIDRLRAELLRRAKQVETLSRDLSTTRGATAPVADPAARQEPGWKAINAAPETPTAESVPAPSKDADEAGLKRLLHAAHRARQEMQERLSSRERELEQWKREKNELAASLETARAELESQAAERNRVQELESNLSTRATSYERISDECNTLRRALVESQREAAEARKASERNREVLAETRSRVLEREAEAGALRAALATNQKQAQARDCDNEELQAALTIASETLESRRAELRQARAELESTTVRLQASELQASQLANELRAQSDRTNEQTTELSRLKTTLPRLESDLKQSRSEFESLRDRLAQRESELVDLRESMTRMQLERDRLGDELATEREALARAHVRATQREATLTNLRETLASIGKAASVLPMPADPDEFEAPVAADVAPAPPESTTPARAARSEPDARSTVEDEPFEALPELTPARDETAAAAATGAETGPLPTEVDPVDASNLIELVPHRASLDAPAIFRMWRDRQIAKKLAPLGVSNADEYFGSAISPLFANAPETGLEILSLGGEDPEFELRIARGLRKLGHEGFRVRFPEVDPEHGAEIVRKGSQAGLDSELVPFARNAIPDALGTLRFQAIVGDGALSRSTRVEPLVLALADASRKGAVLALAERVGRGGSRTAREMGDRIWRLMPERYKHNAVRQEIETTYWQDELDAGREEDLLALLRTHFAFEDFASFGHLVDRFVGPEIGPNFDPTDDRDRRFIEQIANLDEAKLDSGALAPLHMIARLTARDPFIR